MAKANHLLGLVFNTIDADDDGILRSPEEALTKVKTTVFNHVLDEVFPTFAGDDDKLGPKDFTRYWKSLSTSYSDLAKARLWPELLDKLSNVSRLTNNGKRIIKDLQILVQKVDKDVDGEFSKQELMNLCVVVLKKFDENNDEIVDIEELTMVASNIGILDVANLKRDRIEYEILVSKTKPFFKTFFAMVDDSDKQLAKADLMKILNVNFDKLYEGLEKDLKVFNSDWSIFVRNLKSPFPDIKNAEEELAMADKVMTWFEGEILSLTFEGHYGKMFILFEKMLGNVQVLYANFVRF